MRKIDLKYRMPAEWEPHEGTWLAWPHLKEHWPGNFPPIPAVFAEMTRALATSEKVFICVNDETMEREARALIGDLSNIFFYRIPTNSSWIRDYGPIFVRDAEGKLIITDWIFNGWGNRWPQWPYDLDDAVPQRVAEACGFPIVTSGIVLEGGSIDVNGKGALLTTESCLLSRTRNPHLNRSEIEDYLEKYFGATHVIWLKEELKGDDTSGHIDDLARFVNPTTVVACLEENEQDENYEVLKKNFELLKASRDQDDHSLNVIPLPMPNPVMREGERLPASYANFYIANTVVLLPTYRCKQDEEAAQILERVFPGRKIVSIDCTDLIWGLGAFHCSTQQQPKDASNTVQALSF